jgi:cytochrome c oxidase subunit III
MSTKPTALAHHFADLEQQHEAASLGMWIFLATEVMVFGGLFTAYAVYRALFAAEFAAASEHLNPWFGAINTIVLLTSSLTMAMAVHEARFGHRRSLTAYLTLTALLGTAFLVIKGFEYAGDYQDRLVPGLAFDESEWRTAGLDPNKVKLFLLLYYIMTGLHAVHLIIGIGILVVLTLLARRGWFSPVYYSPVEVSGLYWHFVDVIWIFLLPLLYLVGAKVAS